MNDYEVHDHSAWIDLGRPEAMNALDAATVERLSQGVARAAVDDSVRVVVIHGHGPAFCAGADLKAVQEQLERDPAAVAGFLAEIGAAFQAIADCPLPVIAAVQGMAIAGGLELVLACDLVVASDTAIFSDGHATYGLFPGAGATVRLPRVVGETLAKEMLLTGGRYT